MDNILDEGMLIQRIDVRRVAKSSDNPRAQLAILIKHMDGTDYAVGVTDKRETPEYLTTLLSVVTRGANAMIRALDLLRAIGYVDTRPVALLGRQIIFGLDRVTLELEIIEHIDGKIEYGISVASVDQRKAEEVGRVLEENGIDVV